MAWDTGWDDIFRKFDRGKYPSEDLIRFVARNFYQVADRSTVHFLEVGCGTGPNLWYLAREGFSAYGIDGSAVAINIAGERFSQENLAVDLQVGDAMSLPYDDECFDIVFDLECLYANTMRDTRVILSEVKRVLKPTGVLFSKTFMTGTYGDGNGPALEGEPNTYLDLTESALNSGYGIIRFSSRKDIEDLYSLLNIDNIESVVRSLGNGEHEIKEWIITCSKPA